MYIYDCLTLLINTLLSINNSASLAFKYNIINSINKLLMKSSKRSFIRIKSFIKTLFSMRSRYLEESNKIIDLTINNK